MKFSIYIALALFVALNSTATSFAQSNAQDVEAGKLKFLSCNPFKNDPMASSTELTDWTKNFFLTNAKKSTSGNDMTTPIEINEKFLMNGACLENIKIFLGPGAMVVQGEVCNPDLNDFRSALASVGIQLSSGSVFSGNELPPRISNRVIASSKDDTRRLYRSYFIVEGGLDFGKMEMKPIKNKYLFFCER
jgi:hypothetical protein